MMNDLPIGLLSDEEKEYAVHCLGGFIKTLGDNIYHLGNGTLTGEAGWIAFINEFAKQMKEWSNLKDE